MCCRRIQVEVYSTSATILRVINRTGKTINISRNGVLFSASDAIPPGKRLTLAISWPARPNGKYRLKLAALGHVVWCDGTFVAVRIDKCNFCTQGVEPPHDAA